MFPTRPRPNQQGQDPLIQESNSKRGAGSYRHVEYLVLQKSRQVTHHPRHWVFVHYWPVRTIRIQDNRGPGPAILFLPIPNQPVSKIDDTVLLAHKPALRVSSCQT